VSLDTCTLKGLRAAAALLTVLVCVPPKASTQALPLVTGPGTYVAVGGGVSAFQADYGQRVLGGGVVYADVNPTWRYGFEGEARYLHLHTAESVSETNYLSGIRVALRPWGIQPYAKVLVGAGRISLPFQYGHGTYFTYAPGGGVDYTITDRLSARLIDFEYQLWPDFSFGALRPYGISAGLKFRLNAVETVPDSKQRLRR
jgi:hypothetical protein